MEFFARCGRVTMGTPAETDQVEIWHLRLNRGGGKQGRRRADAQRKRGGPQAAPQDDHQPCLC